MAKINNYILVCGGTGCRASRSEEIIAALRRAVDAVRPCPAPAVTPSGIVLPTRTVPMGITAMLNFDPSVNAETNTINMMAAADKVSTGLITYAARDSEYDGKRIKKGEIMALENGKIVSTSNDITKATYRLARGMCKKDSSFVTIISGCDVSDEDAEKVTEIVKAKCPNHVEVSHIRGGQPVYYYMISVE